jgi:hypothetical protein
MSATERKRRQREREKKAQTAFTFDRPQEKASHNVTPPPSHRVTSVTKPAVDNVTSHASDTAPDVTISQWRCSFCRKPSSEVDHLLVVKTIAVCNECLARQYEDERGALRDKLNDDDTMLTWKDHLGRHSGTVGSWRAALRKADYTEDRIERALIELIDVGTMTVCEADECHETRTTRNADCQN